ncbi:hypothetical protein SGL43_00332 [Streptomyces globisporus]|uniref:Uncharacterized protein n=1 Tax=Streptomyces globisporus TaxID=1908 RepID=A0ABN8USV5_STRGL|nr:hypothetical protein SGL43_00332 [Streptomyces globisporus]
MLRIWDLTSAFISFSAVRASLPVRRKVPGPTLGQMRKSLPGPSPMGACLKVRETRAAMDVPPTHPLGASPPSITRVLLNSVAWLPPRRPAKAPSGPYRSPSTKAPSLPSRHVRANEACPPTSRP